MSLPKKTNQKGLLRALREVFSQKSRFSAFFSFALAIIWLFAPLLVSANYGDFVYEFGIYGGDVTAPTLSQVTPVDTPTGDTTPNYTFNSSEAGTISYGGSCSSATTSASSGNNTITFNTLSSGTYSNCTITVTDTYNNASAPLSVSSFTIDPNLPVLTEVTPVPTPSTDTTPTYVFNASEAGTLTYGGSCSSATTSASSGNNTITFIVLALGTYTDCIISLTDSSDNESNTLVVTSFTITRQNPDDDEEAEEEQIDISRPRISWFGKVTDLVRNITPRSIGKHAAISGRDEELAGGEVRVEVDGEKIGTDTIESDGKWRKKITFKKSGKYDITLQYSHGNFKEKRKYRVRVDAEEPVFDYIPGLLHKFPGARIYWNAKDNEEVREYSYAFQGRIEKTNNGEFFLPKNLKPGLYPLVLKAYDKTGNRATKSVMIRVR